MMNTRSIRAAWRAPSAMAIEPPTDEPPTLAVAMHSASISATSASAKSCAEKNRGGGSLSPCPGMSHAITR